MFKSKSSRILRATLLVALCTLMCLSAVALASCSVKESRFVSGDISITLPDNFIKTEVSGYEAAYGDKKSAVLIQSEIFLINTDEEKRSTAEYAADFIAENDLESSVTVKSDESLTYFEYTRKSETNDTEYRYFAAVYKNEETFWLVQCGTKSSYYDSMRNSFVRWAKSVSFDLE